jgi:hypothetical protein
MNRLPVIPVLCLLLWSCSGTTTSKQVLPTPVAPPAVTVERHAEAPRPTAPKDPFLDKLERFEAAYRELSCRANPDFDPTIGFGTLREPCGRLKELVEVQSMTLENWERILRAHGFADSQAFFKDMEYIRTARPGWIEQLQGRLMEFLMECKKN